MPPESRHTGLLLADRYTLDEAIGQGALCTIYRGSDTVLRRSVAVKAVAPELVERYRAALSATAGLTHPAAVATYDALEHDGWLFLVQEYVTGRPLSAYLRDGVPCERAVNISCQVARAVEYAHARGIVHGDVTPAAVLVDRQAVARVNNFAAPRDMAYFERCRREWAEGGGGADGEPPEQGEDATGDVRAVGYLLWQMLSEPRSAGGANGAGGAARREFRPDVPERVRACVRRCVVTGGESPDGEAIRDAETLVVTLETVGAELASARTPATEQTPPALRVAREMIEREAAWSAEETLGGVRYWAEGGGSNSYAPSAPTDPMPREERPWRGMTPTAELTPRLRLPSRPVDDGQSVGMSDYAAMAAGAPRPMAAANDAQPAAGVGAGADVAPMVPHGKAAWDGWYVSVVLVVGVGIVLFLLFFILGYFSAHFFGIG